MLLGKDYTALNVPVSELSYIQLLLVSSAKLIRHAGWFIIAAIGVIALGIIAFGSIKEPISEMTREQESVIMRQQSVSPYVATMDLPQSEKQIRDMFDCTQYYPDKIKTNQCHIDMNAAINRMYSEWSR